MGALLHMKIIARRCVLHICYPCATQVLLMCIYFFVCCILLSFCLFDSLFVYLFVEKQVGCWGSVEDYRNLKSSC